MADNNNEAIIEGLEHSLQEGQANIAGSITANQASLDAGWAAEAQRSHDLDQVFESLNGPTPGFVAQVAGDQHGEGVIDALPVMDGEMTQGLAAPDDAGEMLVAALAAGDLEGVVDALEDAFEEGLGDADIVQAQADIDDDDDVDALPTAADMTFDGSQ